jgi:uncharacterized membrane protein YkvA (DUF1232 family)
VFFTLKGSPPCGNWSSADKLSQGAAARLGRAARPALAQAAKLVTVLAALYIVSPIDFVPDTIPILGWLDDGLIGFLLLQLAFSFSRPGFWHHCANAWAPSSVRSQSLQP